MYYIFAAFNGAAFIHMFFFAHETKGFTLEEMDDIFDSGRPAWKGGHKPTSRFEELQKDIEQGKVKVSVPAIEEEKKGSE